MFLKKLRMESYISMKFNIFHHGLSGCIGWLIKEGRQGIAGLFWWLWATFDAWLIETHRQTDRHRQKEAIGKEVCRQ